jgi:hypothetical protein
MLDLRFSRQLVWRWLSAGLLHHVVWQNFTDVSEVLACLLPSSDYMAQQLRRSHFEDVNASLVALGGLVVSVLATGPKVRGFKPGRGRCILRVIKSVARLPSEGKESRRSHVVDLWHVKEPYEHDRYSSAKFSSHVTHPRFTCFATGCLLALLTDVPGGHIRWPESGWSWGW